MENLKDVIKVDEFSNGVEIKIPLGVYFELFRQEIINGSPEYQRPYSYSDGDENNPGDPWQRGLIASVLKNEKIPSLSLRKLKSKKVFVYYSISSEEFIIEIIDGGHRTRTLFNFRNGLLKTPEGLELSLNGKVYDSSECGNKTFEELPKDVQNFFLNEIKLSIDLYTDLTDDEAGEKFRTLNNLHEMSAQEKRQSHKVQISKSIRELGAIDTSPFSFIKIKEGKNKFKYTKLKVTGRETDELIAVIAKNIKEKTYKTLLESSNKDFSNLYSDKGSLDRLYENDLHQLEEKNGTYHIDSKTIRRVKRILQIIDNLIIDNVTNKSFSKNHWTKGSILKFSLILNELIDKYGIDSVERMDTQLFFTNLVSFIKKPYKFRAYSRYELSNGEVKTRYEKNVEKVVNAQLLKVWTGGYRIDDFEFVYLHFMNEFNPSDWGVIKLDKRRFFTPEQFEEIKKNDNYQCVNCGSKEDLTGDHKIAWSKGIDAGGVTEVHNGETLCRSCNSSKNDLLEKENLLEMDYDVVINLLQNGKITAEDFKFYNQNK
jgi:hypothetical protein